MDRLKGKVAIVTGAAGGIGSATAAAVAREGAHVVVADLDADGAHRVASEIQAEGWSALDVGVDIAQEDSVAHMIDVAVRAFGHLDVLHNNAAATTLAALDDPIEEARADVWLQALQTNVMGTMFGIKHAIPYLRARGGGSIINTASGAGHHGDLSHPAYGVSKAGVVMLTEYAATMYGKEGIRVNAISPGLIVNPAKAGFMPKQFLDVMLDNHLTPRVGRPSDIANAVVFLASDESEFLTGQVIKVDGGSSAHAPYYAQFRAAGGWRGIMGGETVVRSS